MGSQKLYMTEQLSIHTLCFEQLILQIHMHRNIYDQRFLKYLRDCSISPPPLKNNLSKEGCFAGYNSPASDPITSRQIDGETMATVIDFIFLGSKISVDSDCSHKFKRCLLLGRQAMTNLRQHVRKQRHSFINKVYIVKAMVFPVVLYGCENWAKRKLRTKELMLSNCGAEKES